MVAAIHLNLDDASSAEVAISRLQQLERATDQVFLNLTNRIEQEHRRVSKIRLRTKVAQEKVCRLVDRARQGKASTVFATSKFPTPQNDWKPIGFHTREETCMYRPQGSVCLSEESKQMDLQTQCLAIGKVLIPIELEGDRVSHQNKAIPQQLTFVPEAVQFDSEENPFEMSTLPRRTSLSVDGKDEDSSSLNCVEELELGINKLGDTPPVLLDGQLLPHVMEYDVSYKPTMKDMTQFKLPSNLNLPDIADISFQDSGPMDVQTSIAPSVHYASLPELPSVFDLASPPSASFPAIPIGVPQNIPTMEPPSTRALPTYSASSSSSSFSSPPSSQPADQTTSSDEPQQGTRKEDLIPAVHETNKISFLKEETPSVHGGSKQDLLSAIRNQDNLARLKKTAEARRRETHLADNHVQEDGKTTRDDNFSASSTLNPADKKGGEGLSLAQEMKLKLARRQKILSGQQDEEEQQADQARKAQLQGSFRVVQAAGKFKAAANRGSGMFSLDNISSLDDILQAKESLPRDDDGDGFSSSSWSDDA